MAHRTTLNLGDLTTPQPVFTQSRRDFLRTSLGIIATTNLTVLADELVQKPKLRAAIIGHTGRGDYGHAIDQAFLQHPELNLVAIADAHPVGLQRANERLKVPKAYLDFREMLEKERPDIVGICPRHTDQRLEMATAALEAGAHLCLDKPFASNIEDADAILAEARSRNLKVATNLHLRLQPAVQWLIAQATSGAFGKLHVIQASGRGGNRAGGEDMAVLGIDMFDLMRAFAGDPLYCQSTILTDDRDIVIQDAHVPADNVGLVAGTAIFSEFMFPNGVRGTFSSSAIKRAVKKAPGRPGMVLQFADSTIRINTELPCQIFQQNSGEWKSVGKIDEWTPTEGSPTIVSTPNLLADSTFPVVDSLVKAIRQGSEPLTSGFDGVKNLEMVSAVYRSALEERRIHFPLLNRKNPLSQPATNTSERPLKK